jgi:hypothetical protein
VSGRKISERFASIESVQLEEREPPALQVVETRAER